jgi:phage terminase small subunit
MAKQIRSKKSTVSNSLETMRSVMSELEPPITLSHDERLHFDRIVTSREVMTWSQHDLSLACQLAKAMARQELLNQELEEDGLTLINERGTRVAHPLLSASMTIASTIQSLTRTLGLSASQRGVAGESQAKRNQAEQVARKVIAKASEDDLLA